MYPYLGKKVYNSRASESHLYIGYIAFDYFWKQ